ncbi:putative ankyrin repeat protein [Fusarium oxysporum f. sp. rapae]|uniref:Putative ankyrin repeat protein n=1 Tax=Fusarium oxysporum f. sp. rapae TaxID=485398 RepID=A0A8J5NIR4_FUSOX|nr:putative ankyrin repeat protein [Fusarium oxysporum f. sp. rapae]
MPPPPLPDYESPYEEFTVDPNQESESHGYGRPFATPMTMINEDGSILYETEDFGLLYQIVDSNDTRTLEQYLTVAPWVLPKASGILLGNHGIDDNEDCFLNAAQSGCLDVLKILLSHFMQGDDLDLQARFKQRRYKLLNSASKWGHIEVVNYLLDNQPLYADIHERDPNGYTALLSAADLYFTQFLVPPGGERANPVKNESVMNLLLDRGACASDVVPFWNDKDKPTDTVLTLAVKWASPELIKRLIVGGADPNTMVIKGPGELSFWNQRDSYYEFPALFVACTHANFNAIRALIESRGTGVDIAEIVSSRDSRGSIPIHWATQSDLPGEIDGVPDIRKTAQSITSIIELLLSLDPTTINIQDNDGNTPLHYATRSLSRHNTLYTNVFQLLCDRGGDASVRNNNGETPLHTLFRLYDDDTSHTDQDPVDTSAISILLAHGASSTDTDNAGNTTLHFAAFNLHWADAVSYLLERGADPAQQNLKQETALHRAACGSYKGRYVLTRSDERIRAQDDMLAVLVKAGAEELMDRADAEGNTPRQICQNTRDEWRMKDRR